MRGHEGHFHAFWPGRQDRHCIQHHPEHDGHLLDGSHVDDGAKVKPPRIDDEACLFPRLPHCALLERFSNFQKPGGNGPKTAAGFQRAVHWLPSAPRGLVERALDRYEAAVAELYGE